MSDSTDRYVIEIGSGTVAHVIDTAAGKSEESERLTLGPQPTGEKMCSRGHRRHGFEQVSLSEFATRQGFEKTSFEGDVPEGVCSYCWSNTLEAIAERRDRGVDDTVALIGAVGYRLRWKQKGRARAEWYDVVVRPETTMAELDRLVCRFTTLDDLHLRMYGLEDEYMDSTLNVLPDRQYEAAGDPSYTRASELTIADVAERATLREGDRLSLVYDFGTPSYYYCIIKDSYEPEEIDALLEDSDVVAATETAAIVREKRPETEYR
jgi:hypothetical protein